MSGEYAVQLIVCFYVEITASGEEEEEAKHNNYGFWGTLQGNETITE